MRPGDGTWNDSPCSIEITAFCEKVQGVYLYVRQQRILFCVYLWSTTGKQDFGNTYYIIIYFN